jgi:tRNA (cmo5U34)-methyltransferase
MQDQYHNEWKTEEHAFAYLARADNLPHRTEGEKVLLEQIPTNAMRILDLGTGNGRLLALVRINRPNSEGIALDYSEPMLTEAKKRFASDKNVRVVKHDFALSLPQKLGKFDAVVSSLAIHHCTDERKKELYQEIFDLMNSGGVFCNFEHVSSPSDSMHRKFLSIIGQTPETEDKSNKLMDVETQLQWLRKIGFTDVDCYWKWMEVALLVGFKPQNHTF